MSANVGATIEEYEEWLAEFETPQQSTPSIMLGWLRKLCAAYKRGDCSLRNVPAFPKRVLGKR